MMTTCILKEISPGKKFTRDRGKTYSIRARLFPWDSQAPCVSLKTGQIYYLSFSTEVQQVESRD